MPNVGELAHFFKRPEDAPLYIADEDFYRGDPMIYTVKIETRSGENKYYVGSTTMGVKRFQQHATLGAKCAEFVKRHAQNDASRLSFSTHRFSYKGECDIGVSETREAQIRAMFHGVTNVSGGEVTSRQSASETRRAICCLLYTSPSPRD